MSEHQTAGVVVGDSRLGARRRLLTVPTVQLAATALLLIAVVSSWFITSAALRSLEVSFALPASAATTLLVTVQLGFALGAGATGLLRVADRVTPASILPAACAAVAVADVLPIVVRSWEGLSISRALVGVLLGVIYPIGMRAAVSWFSGRARGPAVACVVAALTLGSASPQLIRSVGGVDWEGASLTAACLAVVAAAIALVVVAGPHSAAPGRTTLRAAAALMTDRAQIRVSVAYIGHMWETYAFWVWVPALIAVLPGAPDGPVIGLLAFVIIGIAGVVGCLLGGLVAGRWSQRGVARTASVVSCACGASMLVAPELPFGVVLAVLVLWGVAVIADSAMYSAMTGAIAGSRPVGSAIAVQMAVGYALSAAAVVVVARIASTTSWPIALATTAIAPAVSVALLGRSLLTHERPVRHEHTGRPTDQRSAHQHT